MLYVKVAILAAVHDIFIAFCVLGTALVSCRTYMGVQKTSVENAFNSENKCCA